MRKHYTLSGLLFCLMTLLTLGASAAPDKNYLCFTAEKANSQISLRKSGTPTNVAIEYSTDGDNWYPYPISTAPTPLVLQHVGDKVYFRNANKASDVTGFSKSTNDYYYFYMPTNSSFSASGNVMSLVDKECKTTTIPCDYCFSKLFYNNCTVLTSAPELPATTLASNCYYQMFYFCSSLTTAPELPATTQENKCYYQMFLKCSNLTEIKVALYSWITDNTNNWVGGVASEGMFYCPKTLEGTGPSSMPSTWTVTNTYDVTGTAIGWTSLCVNLPLEVPEGAKVYYASTASGSTITLEAIEAGTVMAAKTAVIVKADASTTVSFPIAGEAGTSYDNLFQGSSVDKAKTEDVYVLAGKSTPDKPVFQPYTGTTLGAHKIWLPKSAVGGASSIQFRFADATAVSTVETEAAEDVIYNLAGQRVGSDYRGLVIKNGKKMWNK